MLLIAREELILAVVEGVLLSVAVLFVLGIAYGMVEDFVVEQNWHWPRWRR